MKLDLYYDELLPHPIETVWRAITDRDALAEWLMTSDFTAEVGHEFTMRGAPIPGWRGWVDCKVLELDAPHRMVWSWLDSDHGEPTTVVFELEPRDGSTRLQLRHTGEIAPDNRRLLQKGWPEKLASLAELLQAGRRARDD